MVQSCRTAAQGYRSRIEHERRFENCLEVTYDGRLRLCPRIAAGRTLLLAFARDLPPPARTSHCALLSLPKTPIALALSKLSQPPTSGTTNCACRLDKKQFFFFERRRPPGIDRPRPTASALFVASGRCRDGDVIRMAIV